MHFQHLKKGSQIISLGNKLSRLLTSEAFRETVLSKIAIRSKHLRFKICDYSTSCGLDLALLCPANHISLVRCTAELNVFLGDIDQIDLIQCSVKDLSFCSQVRKVNIFLSVCENFLTIPFSAATGLSVDFAHQSYKIENYKCALSEVKPIFIHGCDFISDVRCFQNCHTACLSRCRNISDVSSLGNLHDLDLHGCNQVRDVSALGKVHKLNIGNCPLVEDIF
jgi:hypothetical protein